MDRKYKGMIATGAGILTLAGIIIAISKLVDSDSGDKAKRKLKKAAKKFKRESRRFVND